MLGIPEYQTCDSQSPASLMVQRQPQQPARPAAVLNVFPAQTLPGTNRDSLVGYLKKASKPAARKPPHAALIRLHAGARRVSPCCQASAETQETSKRISS